MKARKAAVGMLILGLMVSLSSCKGEPPKPAGKDSGTVIATLFPLYDFAKNVAGDRATFMLLLPPGIEPHSFEPKPGDVERINRADLFVYAGEAMEPWVVDILKGVDHTQLLVVDASSGIPLMESPGAHRHDGEAGRRQPQHEPGSVDPHIWLDLSNAQRMVDNILRGLLAKDPANRDTYRENAERYKAKLGALDEQFRRRLSTCRKKVFIHGGHFAFQYLARRYHLEYISAYGGSPDAEPTPGRLIELKKAIKANGLHHIFYEELITPRVAEILARETGVTMLRLHGAHNISREERDRGITFIGLMEENLKNLAVGLQCQ